MATSTFVASAVDPRDRGRELGVALRDQVRAAWETYDAIFTSYERPAALVREVAEHAFAAVADWAPSLAEEMEGLAEGAGLETWQVAAVNARSEVLATYRAPVPGECSTAVFVPEGESPRTIQTWDWHEGLLGFTLLWQLEPRPGWTVRTFTEVGLLGKIGVNSAGLGLHFNLLQHDADGGTGGVPVHLVARRVLDEAATLDEAEAIVRSARTTASVALTVVTREGAATFEVSPVGVRRVAAFPGGIVLHTNHFLHPDSVPDERYGPTSPDTYARLGRMVERSAELRSPDPGVRAAVMATHEEDGAALCCHPGERGDLASRWLTLITICLDVDKGRIAYRDGSPCETQDDGWSEF